MLTYFAILTATIGVTVAGSTSPEWNADYGTALQQTRGEHRPLLMVIDEPATADKAVAADLLSTDAKGDLANYELCHIDASTEYGQQVAKAFSATKLPYVAVIDNSGKKVLHSQAGEVSADKWNEIVSKYRDGALPVRHVAAKPVVTTPVSNSVHSYEQYQPSAKPYCAKCQRGY